MKKGNKFAAERAMWLFDVFAGENAVVREYVASMLPTYNELLNLRARSFAEFALREAAKEQGQYQSVGMIDYSKIRPKCPLCGEEERITPKPDKGKPFFFCNNCNSKYPPHYKSICADTKVPSLVWMKVLRCMLDFFSIDRICDVCGISRETFYKIRNKLFYAMELHLQEIKLYGLVQMDLTFVPISFRGVDLSDPDDIEGTVFDKIDFKPRDSRVRGGSYSRNEYNVNTVCIMAAIDDRGHVTANFVGLGAATASRLERAVGKDKLLQTVPRLDPSPYFKKERQDADVFSAGENTLLVSDMEHAIEAYAKRLEVKHEAHVYRRKGVQVRLPSGSHDIQKVNALHQRLKRFLHKISPSSKYLPGYLTFFSWIENFGATPEAIDQLFTILALPKKGKPAAFFEERYQIPNYLMQWLLEDNPLKNFSYNRLLAYYLYRQRKEYIFRGLEKDAISTREIAERTGYSESTIRRNYNNLYASGFDDLIMKYFSPQAEEKRSTRTRIYLSPERLALFDEYVPHAPKGSKTYMPIAEFCRMINERDGSHFSRQSLWENFRVIVESGLRPPLPKAGTYADFSMLTPWERKTIEMQEEYEKTISEALKRGDYSRTQKEIARDILLKYGSEAESIEYILAKARGARRKLEQMKKKK